MKFRSERGIGYCGLACVLCSDENCLGCKTKSANGDFCDVSKCGADKKVSGCYACSDYSSCGEGMLQGKRNKAFNRYAQEFGEEALIERLRINYENGVTYHTPDKSPGSYDLLETEEEIYSLLRFGTTDQYKIMYGLNQSGEKLSRLTSRDVRIIHLPLLTVAAYRVNADASLPGVGTPAMQAIDKLVRENDLLHSSPGIRRFGLYTHTPDKNGDLRFELCVTIPDDMEICEPLEKKQFHGGLYAAHTIPVGAYDEWNLLKDWCERNDLITFDWANRVTPVTTEQNWVIEELLNYRGENIDNTMPLQVDLLLPIKKSTE